MRSAIVFIGVTAALAFGCAAPAPSTSSTPRVPSPTAEPSPAVTLADAADCPVTKPRQGPSHVTPEQMFGWGSAHGNGKLWVGGLAPGGIIEADPGLVDDNGAVGMKFGWWREVQGRLEITGRRLDGSAPPARGEVPSGYGSTGFTPSGVWFPAEGCWEIEGRVDNTALTFVTFVIKV